MNQDKFNAKNQQNNLSISTYSQNPVVPAMKNFDIDFYKLTAKHLHIRYWHGGKKQKITLTPAQTCEVLDNINLITGYTNNNGKLTIITETSWATPGIDGEPIEESGIIVESWYDFAIRFDSEVLNSRYALIVAQYFHERKEAEEWAASILSIPTLVRNIPNSK